MDTLTIFDYSQLDDPIQEIIQQKTGTIHRMVRRTAQDIIEIGQHLIEVKKMLPHGTFRAWSQAEFGWKPVRVTQFINVAKRLSNVQDPEHLPSALDTLALLAAPSTPEAAREELLERSTNGRDITYRVASEIVAKHKVLATNLPEATKEAVMDNLIASNLDNAAQQLVKIAKITDPEIKEQVITRMTGDDPPRTVERAIREAKISQGKGGTIGFSSLIKPTDNWNFSRVMYNPTPNGNGHGYIPGEIYVNAFWYYVQPGQIVVDPMAGSGMAKVVYDDRKGWMGEHKYDFELHLFDLTPQNDFIQPNDLLQRFPLKHADYIFIDPPYYGMVNKQYSKADNDLANMELEAWQAAMTKIATNCARGQKEGGLCSVVIPNYRDHKTGRLVMCTQLVCEIWEAVGYTLYDKAYAPRRIQQAQTPTMARLNNIAKDRRTMLTDMAEVLTFVVSQYHHGQVATR